MQRIAPLCRVGQAAVCQARRTPATCSYCHSRTASSEARLNYYSSREAKMHGSRMICRCASQGHTRNKWNATTAPRATQRGTYKVETLHKSLIIQLYDASTYITTPSSIQALFRSISKCDNLAVQSAVQERSTLCILL